MLNVNVSTRFINRAFVFQLIMALIFAILSLIAGYLWFDLGHDYVRGFVPQFYADQEANIPNWYSANVILFNAVLLGFIGWVKKREEDPFKYHWIALSAIMVFLSCDEITSLHNQFDDPVRSLLHTSGVFWLAWVIPYGIFSLVVGLSYIKFLRDLPSRTALFFLGSGAFYVFAALGMEMIESPLEQKYGAQNMLMASLASVEESLELVAMAIFNYSVLHYLREMLSKPVAITSDFDTDTPTGI